jgi:hypothetical protein
MANGSGIDFDVEELIGKLDIIEKTQIPFAANQALKRFGHLMKTQLLPAEMLDKFTAPDGMGSPVPFTLNSLLHDTQGMTLTLSFKGTGRAGLSPKQYLYSAFYGGKPTETALSKAIQGITGMYPIPAYGNLKALGALTPRMDIKGSYSSKVISGLEGSFVRKAQPSKGERFVASVFGPLRNGDRNRGGLRSNAVYRIKGSSIATVFILGMMPTLKPALEYNKFVEREAEKRLPDLISLSLQRAMASR